MRSSRDQRDVDDAAEYVELGLAQVAVNKMNEPLLVELVDDRPEEMVIPSVLLARTALDRQAFAIRAKRVSIQLLLLLLLLALLDAAQVLLQSVGQVVRVAVVEVEAEVDRLEYLEVLLLLGVGLARLAVRERYVDHAEVVDRVYEVVAEDGDRYLLGHQNHVVSFEKLDEALATKSTKSRRFEIESCVCVFLYVQ